MIFKKKLMCLLAMSFSFMIVNILPAEKPEKTFSYSPFRCIKEHPIASTIAAGLNGYGISTLMQNKEFKEHCEDYYKRLFRKGNAAVGISAIAAGSLLFAITYVRYFRHTKKCEWDNYEFP